MGKMSIPFKQMVNWKSGNIGPLLIAATFLLIPFLMGIKVLQTTSNILFGLTFLCIALIRAKPSPTVIGSFFTALLGLAYFMTVMTTADAWLWMASLFFVAITVVFEIGLFKFGPSNSKAKVLTIIPVTLLGFYILLGIAGQNPKITFNWNVWGVALSYIALMVFCFLYTFDYAGYKPFKAKTVLYMNIMAIAVLGLQVLGLMQGWGYIGW